MSTTGCISFDVSTFSKTDSADDGVIDWIQVTGSCGLPFCLARMYFGISSGALSSAPTDIGSNVVTITMGKDAFKLLLDCLDGHNRCSVTICYTLTGTSFIVNSVSCRCDAGQALVVIVGAVNASTAQVAELTNVVRDVIVPRIDKVEQTLTQLLEIAATLQKG